MKYQLILGIGSGLDKLLLYIGIIAGITGIVGLIIGAAWTSTAWYTVLGITIFSISWFLFILLFLMKRVKAERISYMKKEVFDNFGKKMKENLGVN